MRIYFSNVTKPRSVSINKISANFQAAYVIDYLGKLWVWGSNSLANLGTGDLRGYDKPRSVGGASKTFCSVKPSGYTGLALDKNGQVWTWGYNFGGSIGNNTFFPNSVITPVAIAGVKKTFCKVFGGDTYCFAIDQYNRAWAWGHNQYGYLGDNSVISRLTPVSIAGSIKTFCHIEGLGNVIALDNNGKLWSWGYNNFGSLGDNSVICRSTPVSVAGTCKTFCKIIGFNYVGAAIDKYGQIWTWGNNTYGKLGINSTVCYSTPVAICGLTKTFCEISRTYNSVFALDKNGKAWCWGLNSSGELGTGDFICYSTPVAVKGINRTFCKIAGGATACYALDKNGLLWGWGAVVSAAALAQRNLYFSSPVSFLGNKKTFCAVNGYQVAFLGLDKYGQIWGWGDNGDGSAGVNSLLPVYSPTKISGVAKTFCKIGGGVSAGGAAAIDQYGQIWGWGYNTTGLVGNNSTANTSTPVSVCGTKKTFCEIANCGSFWKIALDKYGQIWGWGYNTQGQIGDNSTIAKSTPVAICGIKKTFCQIAGGLRVSRAIDQYGQIWSWGRNTNGIIGNNSFLNYCTPVSVCGARKTFCKIGSSYLSSYAIDQYGKIWSWGGNTYGELGDNTVVSKSTPIAIVGSTKTFCEIGAGQSYAIAIDKYGKVWAWGRFDAALVHPSISSTLTPVSLNIANRTFCKIHSATSQVLIDKNGEAWGWGHLNRGTFNVTYSTTPIRICIF